MITDSKAPIQSTAGAIPLRNEKGEIYMQKVHVQRYKSGKRPHFAKDDSSSDDDDDDNNNDDSNGNEYSRYKSLEDHNECEFIGEINVMKSAFPLASSIIKRKQDNCETADVVVENPSDVEEEEEEEEMDDENGEPLDRIERHKRLRQLAEVEVVGGFGMTTLQNDDYSTGGGVVIIPGEDDDDEDEIARQSRRELIRQRALMMRRQQEEQDLTKNGGVATNFYPAGSISTTDLLRQEEMNLVYSDDEQDEDEVQDDDFYDDDSDDSTGGGGGKGNAGFRRSNRLKPVFVRKRDRVTVHQRLENELKEEREQMRIEEEKSEERRRHALRLLNDEVKASNLDMRKHQSQLSSLQLPLANTYAGKCAANPIASVPLINSGSLINPDGMVTLINTDKSEVKRIDDACIAIDSEEEGDNEEEYEKWKIREIKRIRADREVKENLSKDREDTAKVHAMTEEERMVEFKKRPKQQTNPQERGKYKFLQKYYHRGAFFVQEDEEKVFQRDFAQPTLEDHFDKTRLPKVMQVKDFGRAGRTKYTHLVDQDTSQIFDSPWSQDASHGVQFQNTHGGGMKQVFEKPTARRAKK